MIRFTSYFLLFHTVAWLDSSRAFSPRPSRPYIVDNVVVRRRLDVPLASLDWLHDEKGPHHLLGALQSTVKSGADSSKSKRIDLLAIPKAILRQPFRLIAYLHRCLFRAFVSSMAATATAIMMDPAVMKAFASGMKDGINMWFTQPNIKAKLLELQQNLSESEPSLAKPIGEDFPKVFFNFIAGLILQGFDEPDDSKADTSEQSTETTTDPTR